MRRLIIVVSFLIQAYPAIDCLLNVDLLIYGLRPAVMLESIPLSGPGFDVGIEEINRDYSDVLRMKHTYISDENHDLSECDDTSAHFDKISNYYYGSLQNHSEVLLILMHLGCTETRVFAQLSREWNILAVSGGLTYSTLRDMNFYPSTLATGPVQLQLYSVMFEKICGTFEWTNVGFAYDTSGVLPWPGMMHDIFTSNGAVRSGRILLQMFAIAPKPDLPDLLNRISYVSRVIFMSGTPILIRKLMIAAWKQNMTSSEYSVGGPVTWYQNDTDDEIAFRAYGSLMQMITCYDHDVKTNILLKHQFRQIAEDLYGVKYANGQGPSEFTTSSYVVVKMLAQVLNRTIHANIDVFDGRMLAAQFLNKSFSAGSMGEIFIDDSGERQTKICLSVFGNWMGAHFPQRAMFLDHTQPNLQNASEITIQWNTPDKKPPADTPLCGYLGDEVRCRTNSLGTTVTVIVVAAATVSFCCLTAIFWCMRTHRLTHDIWWRLQDEQLCASTVPIPSVHSHFTDSSFKELDDLEQC
ncbi:hypothetical protein BV898_08510 [Hypsibius exemplaris]|uniref:Receptor ligand binding region domain-containing protein n=1 Tax=Hypsibius exemplaris TaxID=2072580 RepID=A0A1W0WQI1_HYPEX|nr:hypothetical protein BV898_08510 [Hypsibius exemplaris]